MKDWTAVNCSGPIFGITHTRVYDDSLSSLNLPASASGAKRTFALKRRHLRTAPSLELKV